MRRFALLATALTVAAGCNRCNTEVIENLPQATDQVDVFDQKPSAKVDVLWMVDNSGTMAGEQAKVASRFNEFFSQLIRSGVNYHIGVVTSDPGEAGVLRVYNGPAVDTCAPGTCRYIQGGDVASGEAGVPCPNPDVDISGLTSNTEIEARLLEECPAQLVFRKLVSVGVQGSSFEEGFRQVATALGVHDVDPVTGFPLRNPPQQNAGFLRDDASLYIIFVSDEDEGAKNDGPPVRYYQRLFESLKGAGNENKVAVAAITGFPDNPDLPPLSDICSVLRTTFDANLSNDDARANALVEAFRSYQAGCVDESSTDGDPNAYAETGGRYIELACRTGGVVANMCEADYTTALDALGANAAGLLRKFTLSRPQAEIAFGSDCEAFTDDDQVLDCDDDGAEDGPLDGPLCVTAIGLEGGPASLVPRDAISGWSYEPTTNSVRFDGGFLPAPGTQVNVRYIIRTARDQRTCQAGG